jgi:hypothetical protein
MAGCRVLSVIAIYQQLALTQQSWWYDADAESCAVVLRRVYSLLASPGMGWRVISWSHGQSDAQQGTFNISTLSTANERKKLSENK